MQGIVTAMVTSKRPAPPIPKKRPVRHIKLYLREWRKFMGKISAVTCADDLEIERESYLRLEREPWRITVPELDIIAKTIGVTPSQLRFPPPKEGQTVPQTLDEMIEDASETVQKMAYAAVRGMVGK